MSLYYLKGQHVLKWKSFPLYASTQRSPEAKMTKAYPISSALEAKSPPQTLLPWDLITHSHIHSCPCCISHLISQLSMVCIPPPPAHPKCPSYSISSSRSLTGTCTGHACPEGSLCLSFWENQELLPKWSTQGSRREIPRDNLTWYTAESKGIRDGSRTGDTAARCEEKNKMKKQFLQDQAPELRLESRGRFGHVKIEGEWERPGPRAGAGDEQTSSLSGQF